MTPDSRLPFVQALTNDSAITITEVDVEHSRGKISILDDG
jgi:hypothetical protein